MNRNSSIERPAAGGGSLPVVGVRADNMVRIDPSPTILEVAEALPAAEVGALLIGDGDRVRRWSPSGTSFTHSRRTGPGLDDSF